MGEGPPRLTATVSFREAPPAPREGPLSFPRLSQPPLEAFMNTRLSTVPSTLATGMPSVKPDWGFEPRCSPGESPR